jgi:predicted secreted hydrolase
MKPFVITLSFLFLLACEQQGPEPSIDLNKALGGPAVEGFKRAELPRAFHFPQDHAAHPGFRNEWWYITGNLKDAAGHHFGYQVTFFRIALSPEKTPSASDWASHQVWMAHVALSDIHAGQHWHDQRLARDAAGLSGQSITPFGIWLEDWQIIGSEQGQFPWFIDLTTESFTLRLQIMPRKPVVLQGDRGLSRKSAEPGNASYYYSFTRLETQGEIVIDDRTLPVRGWSWLDREWSTSALADDQAGWDWFSLQLQDGQELMFYRLRKKEGGTDTLSAGKWVYHDGQHLNLSADDIELTPLRHWSSAAGRRYPIAWELRIPKLNKQLRIEALLDDQEMDTGIIYWEGAMRIENANTREPMGFGYLEMTGY